MTNWIDCLRACVLEEKHGGVYRCEMKSTLGQKAKEYVTLNGQCSDDHTVNLLSLIPLQ